MEQIPEVAKYFVWAYADTPTERRVRWARTSTLEQAREYIEKFKREYPGLKYDLYEMELIESTCRKL